MELTNINPTAKRPADWFVGDVYVTPLKTPQETSRLVASLVRFTPEATRTGTPTWSARRCTAPKVKAWSSAATVRSSGSVPAIRCGRRPARSTGTAARTSPA